MVFRMIQYKNFVALNVCMQKLHYVWAISRIMLQQIYGKKYDVSF